MACEPMACEPLACEPMACEPLACEPMAGGQAWRTPTITSNLGGIMRTLLMISIVLFSLKLFPQDVQEEWINTVPDLSGIELLNDESNNIYVLTEDFSIIKYDTNGNLLWLVNYDNATEAFDFELDASNCLVVTGITLGENSVRDIVTVKFDSDGNLIWEQVYLTPDWATASQSIGLATDSSNNVYVCGYSFL